MKIFYRCYVLQVFMTMTALMVPTGVVHYLASALLALLMFLLWLALRDGMRAEEKKSGLEQLEQLVRDVQQTGD